MLGGFKRQLLAAIECRRFFLYHGHYPVWPNSVDHINHDKEIAIIMINFIIQRKRANHWPIINAEIEAGLVEYLISQVEGEITKHGISKAVQDADDFLGRIVNDV